MNGNEFGAIGESCLDLHLTDHFGDAFHARDVTAMEAFASAVTAISSRSPPAIPPAAFTRTASCMAPRISRGNMMRMEERSKTSLMRVPFSEPLNTIRPEPSAPCIFLPDRFHGGSSGESWGLGSPMKSDGEAASNISFHQLVIRRAPVRCDQRLKMLGLLPLHVQESGEREYDRVRGTVMHQLHRLPGHVPRYADQNPAKPCGLL